MMSFDFVNWCDSIADDCFRIKHTRTLIHCLTEEIERAPGDSTADLLREERTMLERRLARLHDELADIPTATISEPTRRLL